MAKMKSLLFCFLSIYLCLCNAENAISAEIEDNESLQTVTEKSEDAHQEESASDDNLQDFISKEAQMLILPSDDVVLGQLSEDARLEALDGKTYIKEFLANHDYWLRAQKRSEIEKFINNYSNFKNKGQSK